MKGFRSLYLTSDVAKLLKVSSRRVEGWIEQRFIEPAIAGKGPGRPHRFTSDQVILGALILEIQASFGEKSALVGRLFPHLIEFLIRVVRQREDAVILGVSSRPGKIVHHRLLSEREAAVFLTKELHKEHTVTFVNVSAIVARFDDASS